MSDRATDPDRCTPAADAELLGQFEQPARFWIGVRVRRVRATDDDQLGVGIIGIARTMCRIPCGAPAFRC